MHDAVWLLREHRLQGKPHVVVAYMYVIELSLVCTRLLHFWAGSVWCLGYWFVCFRLLSGLHNHTGDSWWMSACYSTGPRSILHFILDLGRLNVDFSTELTSADSLRWEPIGRLHRDSFNKWYLGYQKVSSGSDSCRRSYELIFHQKIVLMHATHRPNMNR